MSMWRCTPKSIAPTPQSSSAETPLPLKSEPESPPPAVGAEDCPELRQYLHIFILYNS